MTKKAINWHGGKHYLAPWILSHQPKEFVHYVEPYFGGGAVLFEMCFGHSEVINDINGKLINFWRALQSPSAFDDLRRLAVATPFSKPRWLQAVARLSGWTERGEEPDVEAALDFFILVRMSRQGLMRDFSTLSKTRTRAGQNENASAWLGAVEGLPEVHQRLRGVVILQEPAVSVILREDSPVTWFYVDPPYVSSTRYSTGEYEYEMTDQDHLILLAALQNIEGKFALSGYPSALYDDFAGEAGWWYADREIDNKASGAKQKGVKIERLWFNYDPST